MQNPVAACLIQGLLYRVGSGRPRWSTGAPTWYGQSGFYADVQAG